MKILTPKNIGEVTSKIFIDTFSEKNMEIVNQRILKDANNEGYAPKVTGQLVNSSIVSTEKNKGTVTYDVDYAYDRYYIGSKTGRKKWLEVSFEENIDVYKKMISFNFEKSKKENL